MTRDTIDRIPVDQMTDADLLHLEGRILAEQRGRLRYRQRIERIYRDTAMEDLIRDLAQTVALPEPNWRDRITVEVLTTAIGRLHAQTGIA